MLVFLLVACGPGPAGVDGADSGDADSGAADSGAADTGATLEAHCEPPGTPWLLGDAAAVEAAWRNRTLSLYPYVAVLNLEFVARDRCPQSWYDHRDDGGVDAGVVGGCDDDDGARWAGVASWVGEDDGNTARDVVGYTGFVATDVPGWFVEIAVDGFAVTEWTTDGTGWGRGDWTYRFAPEPGSDGEVYSFMPPGAAIHLERWEYGPDGRSASWASDVALADGSVGSTCGVAVGDGEWFDVVLVGDRTVRIRTADESDACGEAIADDGEDLGVVCL